jgi:pimeloyl-ACP methyl ester carboxylesterase
MAAAALTWQIAAVDGVELEYRTVGAGEPVVLVHAGIYADWFEPLLKEPALASRYRLVTYHRVGYAGSSDASGSVSIKQQAAQLRALLAALKTERAHIVGHSSGGNISLQLALDSPQSVQSIALLEAAMPVPPAAPGRARIPKAMELYRAGDKAAAVDTFMQAVAGSGYRAVLDRVLPRAVAEADTFFAQELPAISQWTFTSDDARRIGQPVLLVMGGRSHEVSPVWKQRQDALIASLGNAEPFVLDGATHMLHLENPRGLAERLAAFFADHPLR